MINHVSNYNLKGKVKLLSDRRKPEFYLHTCNPHNEDIYEFNEDGFLIKEINIRLSYTPNGNNSKTFTYKYDSGNNIIEKIEIIEGKILSKTNFKYHENGKISESNKEFSCLLSPITKDIINTFFEKFGTEGKEQEERFKKEIISYDKKGNKISELDFDENGKLSSKKTHKYNSDNRLEEVIDYDEDGNILNEENIIHKNEKYESKIIDRDEGDLKMEYSYEYEYDEVENWILKREIVKKGDLTISPNNLNIRKIEYY